MGKWTRTRAHGLARVYTRARTLLHATGSSGCSLSPSPCPPPPTPVPPVLWGTRAGPQGPSTLTAPQHLLGPLTTTFSSPLPAPLVNTLKSATSLTRTPLGCSPRPVARQALGLQAGGGRHSSAGENPGVRGPGPAVLTPDTPSPLPKLRKGPRCPGPQVLPLPTAPPHPACGVGRCWPPGLLRGGCPPQWDSGVPHLQPRGRGRGCGARGHRRRRRARCGAPPAPGGRCSGRCCRPCPPAPPPPCRAGPAGPRWPRPRRLRLPLQNSVLITPRCCIPRRATPRHIVSCHAMPRCRGHLPQGALPPITQTRAPGHCGNIPITRPQGIMGNPHPQCRVGIPMVGTPVHCGIAPLLVVHCGTAPTRSLCIVGRPLCQCPGALWDYSHPSTRYIVGPLQPSSPSALWACPYPSSSVHSGIGPSRSTPVHCGNAPVHCGTAPVHRGRPASLTGGVDVEVGGLVRHVADGLQAGAARRDLAGVAQRQAHVHAERALVDVLPREQHRDLRHAMTSLPGHAPCSARRPPSVP